MKKVAISGASGFVGQSLQHYLLNNHMQPIPIPRDTLKDKAKLIRVIEGCDIIINLSGASIIGRWSEHYKKLLYHSRIDTTKRLVEAMETSKSKPELFISTSAIGIYPQDRAYSEEDTLLADDFLANLCKDWEAEALKAKELGIRTVIFRLGIVLGKEGGALAKMLTPFRLGIGGVIGDGQQPFSYININDLTRAYHFMIEHTNLAGIFNLTTPNPTTNRGMTKALGKHLNKPTILPLPSFVLKLLLGEGSSILTGGQTVLPKRLLKSGFIFEYETIDRAIE